MEHVEILKVLRDLPFNVGKGTVLDVLQGKVTKKIVSNDIYMNLKGYGKLEQHARDDIDRLIKKLIHKKYITVTAPPDKPFWKLLAITPKGLQEIRNPREIKEGFGRTYDGNDISQEAKQLIEQFSFHLEQYNDEQKHAIVSPEKKILCVAGAGSGKTTVLTQRIQFLTKYRGVSEKNMLAITFTRKARKEMQQRLGGLNVDIVTFNGFCEKLLRKHGRAKPIISFGQKMRLFHETLQTHGINVESLLLEYYTEHQRKDKTNEELARKLMIDVFSIMDHYANEAKDMPLQGKNDTATTLLQLAKTIQEKMEARNVRDYCGQLTETLTLFAEKPETIPKYVHVLVDEYQDINTAQQKLLDLLQPDNLFVVGDPRQSIYGWRGSKIDFIRGFDANCVVQLKKNYRSHKNIIEVMNKQIASMKLPGLEGHHKHEGTVQVLKYGSEEEERRSITELLRYATHNDIFVLARTNRQLEDLSKHLIQADIEHTIKDEEGKREIKGITLATVHAIKGLEAKTVIVLGCTSRYFPCKISDHPVIDLIKEHDLDREEEERRLLYVALSRAKEQLILTYAGTISYLLDGALAAPQKKLGVERNDDLYEELRKWRANIAKEKGLPAYCIVSDKTLRALTEHMPKTEAQLFSIHGLGQTKIEQYGEDLLLLLK